MVFVEIINKGRGRGRKEAICPVLYIDKNGRGTLNTAVYRKIGFVNWCTILIDNETGYIGLRFDPKKQHNSYSVSHIRKQQIFVFRSIVKSQNLKASKHYPLFWDKKEKMFIFKKEVNEDASQCQEG